jgi:PIN domain nuclease of toxin-antitoxin system
MRILLDTNILLWVITTPERLSEPVRATILDPTNDILFSAASNWEIAIKAALRRAEFRVRPEAVVEEARDIGFIELPVHSSVAARVADLPPHPPRPVRPPPRRPGDHRTIPVAV